MKAYKLVRKMRDGQLAPLFINATLRFEFDKWMQSECHPKKGFAVRQGWHCCYTPVAPHLAINERLKRVWVEVEVEDFKKYDRPESQGGAWLLADKMKVVRELTFEEVDVILEGIMTKPTMSFDTYDLINGNEDGENDKRNEMSFKIDYAEAIKYIWKTFEMSIQDFMSWYTFDHSEMIYREFEGTEHFKGWSM